MIEVKNLDADISLFTVSNGAVSFSAMNYGCTITNLFVLSKNGQKIDILLGFDSLDEWKAGNGSHNAIVGRVANRIRGAKFALSGTEYALDKNDGENCLHGGFTRYEKLIWQGEIFSDSEGEGVRFVRKSAAGEQGFPGNLDLCVSYKLTSQNELIFEYTAQTDKATPINLTNHAYFNLDGGGTILNHHLQLDCDEFLKAKADLTPTGDIVSVSGTAFDFRNEKTIGKDIEELREEIVGASPTMTEGTASTMTESESSACADPFGYDHCFVTRAKDESCLVRFGEVRSEKSGIRMEIFTNQRGCHIYTGNFLAGVKGKSGVVHKRHDGVCFETERFPNAINEPSFPTCVLKLGEKYWHKTVFKLKTEK